MLDCFIVSAVIKVALPSVVGAFKKRNDLNYDVTETQCSIATEGGILKNILGVTQKHLILNSSIIAYIFVIKLGDVADY